MVETGRFHDPGELELQAIEDAVVREVVKAMMAIGYFTEEFWEQERLDWEASQLNGGESRPETPQGQLGAPANYRDVVEVSTAPTLEPSAEPTSPARDTDVPSKEKQQTIRLDGTVVAEPNLHKTSKGADRIIFPLSVGEETHIITSTKERAESINAMTLLPGEEVHVAGVPQNFTRSVNGDLQTQQLIYAWGIRRASTDEEIRVFDSSTIRDVHP